jgi:tRNA (guanine37-N1)-methyltransferase
MNVRLQMDLLTLFPGMVEGFLRESIVGKAQGEGLVAVRVHYLRDWAVDKHHTTDDRPFGGGAGMVLKPEVVGAAVEAVATPGCAVIYLCPDGERLSTPLAKELAGAGHLVLVSGHYEGLDQRVRDLQVTREISIGDYVLTNGTLPAAVLMDCVVRQVPGVLGEEMSLTQDSFNGSLLGFPQYTRPVEYRGQRVPEVLMSGNHGAIAQWRREQQIEKTRARRPDLYTEFQKIKTSANPPPETR